MKIKKTFLVLGLISSITLLLSGCGESHKDSKSSKNDSTVSTLKYMYKHPDSSKAIKADLNLYFKNIKNVKNFFVWNTSDIMKAKRSLGIVYVIDKTNLQDSLKSAFEIDKGLLIFMKQRNYPYNEVVIKTTSNNQYSQKSSSTLTKINSGDILRVDIHHLIIQDFTDVNTLQELMNLSDKEYSYIANNGQEK
ncbi:MAG TPA: hypothetical protein QF753_13965 [Victivallales bacterium]|nr:hypothetical protein [Victivallales bacterium]